MTNEQIKNYLEKYSINSEEQLAKHIEELKRNTTPNNEIIFPLVDMLINEKSVLNSFFAENKKIKNPMTYLDEALENIVKKEQQIIKDWNSNSTNESVILVFKDLASDKDLHLSTRHKSKVGEAHKEKIKTDWIDLIQKGSEKNNNCSWMYCGKKECNHCYPNNKTKETYSEPKEGKKETEGKLDYSEINFRLLDLMAKRFMDNKHKYPKGNTLKVINKEEILWAAFRHIRKMLHPIKEDTETYEDHLAAVATNMSIILDQLKNH